MPPWEWPTSQKAAMFSVGFEHVAHDVAQVRIVGLGDPAAHRLLGRRRGRGDHQAELLLGGEGRKVEPLPVTHRAAAVQIEEKGDLLARRKVIGIVEIELAAGLLIQRADAGHACSSLIRREPKPPSPPSLPAAR
jgi:hypothetical protein